MSINREERMSICDSLSTETDLKNPKFMNKANYRRINVDSVYVYTGLTLPSKTGKTKCTRTKEYKKDKETVNIKFRLCCGGPLEVPRLFCLGGAGWGWGGISRPNPVRHPFLYSLWAKTVFRGKNLNSVL